jgi:hypothetical protein
MSVMLSPANRLTACRSSGAAAASPSVFSSDRPASSSSDGPGCVAAHARGVRDLPARQGHPGGGELVKRPGLGHHQQPEGLVERAGLHAGLRRGQRSLHQARRSGSAAGSIASASTRCTACRSANGDDRQATERTSGCRNRTRAPNSASPASTAGTVA